MNETVLIADDDFDNRTIVREALNAAGYRTILATNGEETLEKIFAEEPAAVLLDLSMPKVNGWQVARRVRENAAMAGLPLIAFTAHALRGEEVKAKAAGCDDYIAKPCLPKDVVARVAYWVEQRKKVIRSRE